ncbi:hypothetical protein VIGAN_01410200 [Vigna angularis var. angularis]|uniref:Uncharacterized protein n=1 Tax=Vigna angularis var. angularis TaxID=157739 RepID=A0A0S3R667_PHAAN|nr:hypothetical protein VIGAN_01410200 [Vigna angularis var. angularis]
MLEPYTKKAHQPFIFFCPRYVWPDNHSVFLLHLLATTYLASTIFHHNPFSPILLLSLMLPFSPPLRGSPSLWCRHHHHQNMLTDYGIRPQCFLFHSTIPPRQKGFAQLQFLPVTTLFFFFFS